MHSVSTAIVLDTRRRKQNGTFPIKLRVTFLRKQKYYITGYSFTEVEYKKIENPKPRGDYKDIKIQLNALEERAVDVIKKMKNFSFDTFEKYYFEKRDVYDDVFSFYERYIDSLHEEGRTGTALSYQNSYHSLREFHRKKLSFDKITLEFLKSYERWMLNKGSSNTTIGIYLRSLRTIFNIAIEQGAISQEAYPFGKRKYQIPAGRNIKKALNLADIEKIFSYEPKNEAEQKARDLWLFSYLCNGINMKDICRLKYQNINEDNITFVRAKTERTSKQNLKPVVAILTNDAKEIIDRWGNKPAYPDNYVFPVLCEGLSPKRKLTLIKQFVKTTNKYLKRIGEELGLELKLTTYVARHSYATVLKRSGAPVEFISESLGHGNLKTTESYLSSFESHIKRQYAFLLTDFKKSQK